MKRRLALLVGVTCGLLTALPLSGQELSEFDYENLSFRGLGVAFGAVRPNRVDPALSYSARVDLGYLGPGVRITPVVSYWSSDFKDSEVGRLEAQLLDLINRNLPPSQQLTEVALDRIRLSDLSIGLDGHMVWALPSAGLLTYAGGGFAAHIMNGDGAAVAGTFVEDLLDRISAGVNAHVGLEYPITPQLRAYGEGRFELIQDLRYLEFRAGIQILVRPTVPAELGG